ncbi:hypothetical protein [Lihuaxuella thermophila]|uniref:Uncharacterized protein n=1 Tax=Lihuaxuella thermophila TaxID=1173111 RepID=A0A1H8BRR8_9BACL|nr:hypothetical protein [Lihuaxuella thermophila]SEM85462.1 hypothetical protein SAMN05444955_102323 [Lihuaxuella thermophila]
MTPKLQKTVATTLAISTFGLGLGSYSAYASTSTSEAPIKPVILAQIETGDDGVIGDESAKQDIEVLIQSSLSQMTPEERNNIQGDRGPIGHTVKALRFIGWVCKKGGAQLSVLLKPLSPKNAALMRKYSSKIGRALEKIESGTKSAVINALVKAGVPKKDAEMLVEVIFWLI